VRVRRSYNEEVTMPELSILREKAAMLGRTAESDGTHL
jgi:hypothetical protein